MADIKKIKVGNTTYNIKDEAALHSPNIIETVEDGFYIIDEQLNIGGFIDSSSADISLFLQ